jgi:phage terminase large subunit GpA-like protein
MEDRLASKDIFDRRFFGECTVSVPGGKIWKEYLGGTASKIVCPCPHCREHVCPEREHLRGWQEAETELAAIRLSHFCCPACGQALSDANRRSMNLQATLIHRGQTIDREGVIHGDPPETLTLGFRWNAFNNMFWSAGAIGWKEWKALRAEDPEAAEKELVQFYWVTPYESPDIETLKFDVDAVQKRWGTEFKGTVPAGAKNLTIGVDLHKRLGWYVVIAWLPEGCGHIVDYGTFDIRSDDFGEQRAFQIALRDFGDRCLAGWSWAGHEEKFVPDEIWFDCRYQGQGKGRPVGDQVVYAFCREAGPRFRPCLGFGASQRGAVPYTAPKQKDKKCKYIGEQYHFDWEAEAGVHVAKINSDFWKTQLKECLSIPARDEQGKANPGAITLFASTDRNEHITFAKHIDAEGPERQFSENSGNSIVWRTKSRQNHLGDAAYLAKAAGHKVGVRVVRTRQIAAIATSPRPPAAPKKSIRPDGRPFLITNRRPL